MCELLVRVQDKSLTGDSAIDCQRTMRGDVIVAMPDGHDWTQEERKHPRWVIVKVPGMSLAEGEALASREVGDGIRRNLRKRLFRLDLSSLPKGDHMVESITLTVAEVRSNRKRKPPVADSDVIGEHRHPDVIG